MMKSLTIFFFAGILLFGVIVGSVYGFARIVDAATYKAKIPEVKTVESSRVVENEIPAPTAALDIKAQEVYPTPEPRQMNIESAPSPIKISDFEKDDDKEDLHEADSEKKEIHVIESSENKQYNKK